ncbi:transposase [Microbacterium sp. KNMS]
MALDTHGYRRNPASTSNPEPFTRHHHFAVQLEYSIVLPEHRESAPCDGKGRALAFILTPGQAADTSVLTATLSEIRVSGARGRPRSRPDRVIADKGYSSRANRAWLRERGIAATIPERDDQIAHRRKRRGRPIDFGDQQRTRYRGRNVVERCFNKLTQWRGIAMRSDKTARN